MGSKSFDSVVLISRYCAIMALSVLSVIAHRKSEDHFTKVQYSFCSKLAYSYNIKGEWDDFKNTDRMSTVSGTNNTYQ